MLALLTVLRSDVVGVPDAALAALWDSGFGSQLAGLEWEQPAAISALSKCIDDAQAVTPTDVPGGGALPRWPVALKGAVGIIAELRRALREDPPDVFVEKLRTRWLAEVTGSGPVPGPFPARPPRSFLGRSREHPRARGRRRCGLGEIPPPRGGGGEGESPPPAARPRGRCGARDDHPPRKGPRLRACLRGSDSQGWERRWTARDRRDDVGRWAAGVSSLRLDNPRVRVGRVDAGPQKPG